MNGRFHTPAVTGNHSMTGFLPHRAGESTTLPFTINRPLLTLGYRSARDSGQDRSRACQMWGYFGMESSIEDPRVDLLIFQVGVLEANEIPRSNVSSRSTIRFESAEKGWHFWIYKLSRESRPAHPTTCNNGCGNRDSM